MYPQRTLCGMNGPTLHLILTDETDTELHSDVKMLDIMNSTSIIINKIKIVMNVLLTTK